MWTEGIRRPNREVQPAVGALDVAIGEDVASAGTSYHSDSLLTD